VVDSHPIITDRESDSIPITTDGHANADVAARVLDRVLDSLRRAEIDRRLDRRRAAPDALIGDGNRDRCPPRERAKSLHETTASQYGRIDPVRQAAQLLDRRFRVVADRLELRDDPLVLDPLPRQPKLDLDRHQPLLGAVVKIALEPTALAFGGALRPIRLGSDALQADPSLHELIAPLRYRYLRALAPARPSATVTSPPSTESTIRCLARAPNIGGRAIAFSFDRGDGTIRPDSSPKNDDTGEAAATLRR
jgi:hypothetical protein